MSLNQSEPKAHVTPGTHAQRPVLITLIVAGYVVLAGALFFGVWHTSAAYTGNFGDFTFQTPTVNDIAPKISATAETQQYFSTVLITSYAPLTAARLLSALAIALPFVIVIVGSIGTITLARRILIDRPFTRTGQTVLTILGGTSVLSSALVSWCQMRAAELAVAELGFVTSGDALPPGSTGWVSPPSFDLLQDLDWPLLTLGVTLLLVSLLWHQAVRMQRDTEGLV